jgi:NTP pyrophosphatase (non-canonical NTP hydrolase)
VTEAGRDVTIVLNAERLRAVANDQPFGAGQLPLDPTATVIVTDWDATSDPDSTAGAYLRKALGLDRLPESSDGVRLAIEARDPLSGVPSIGALRHIYARLRRPDGCPWDREQTELSTLPHIIEETTELQEALEHEDWAHAAEELGDVLGNLIMIAQIAEEQGRFTFEDAVASINAKLVRRHPHVFGNQTAQSPDEVLAIWNSVKQQERDSRSHDSGKETGGRG